MQKRLLLISVSAKHSPMGEMTIAIGQPLGLGILAALTPPTYHIDIIDENISPAPALPTSTYDIVGLSFLTIAAPRAYSIADRLRADGTKVILGGIHASLCPDEAAAHADAVVIGEAESVWPEVINDYEAGAMKTFYHGGAVPMDIVPSPRTDLFSPNYSTHVLQTSRGCPFNCEYCSVTAFNGHVLRQRPLAPIISEMRKADGRLVFIADDNLLGATPRHFRRAKTLFQTIIDSQLNIAWAAQTCVNLADDPELIRVAARSGATIFFTGLETLSAANLRQMNKTVNLRARYSDLVRLVHDHGISLFGGFIFGYDDDHEDVFDRTRDFIIESELDAVCLSVATPYPGTAFYERLRRQNRLLHTRYPADWALHNEATVVFRPLHLSPERLIEGVRTVTEEVARRPAAVTAMSQGTHSATPEQFGGAVARQWNHALAEAWDTSI